MNAAVRALAVFDDGNGPALYAAGDFTVAGGVAANHVAKWDGAGWSPLGSGIDGLVVSALCVFDDGSGPGLNAGGTFTSAGGIPMLGLARWDGAGWSALGGGLDHVLALAVHDDGVSGPALFVGGAWSLAPDSGDSYVARWQGCLDTGPPLLDCPPAVTRVDATGSPAGEVVTFSVTASDFFDPAPLVVSVPPSGSLFPRGTTIDQCTATDAAGHQSACSFPVTVQPKARRP